MPECASAGVPCGPVSNWSRMPARKSQLGRHVDPGGGARIRFARNGAAQPDDQPVLLREPPDHEQTHVPGGVRGDLAAGLQPHVGDPQIGFGHAEPDVADLDDQPAVAGVHGRHPHLRDRRRVAQRVVQQLGEQVHEVAGHRRRAISLSGTVAVTTRV